MAGCVWAMAESSTRDPAITVTYEDATLFRHEGAGAVGLRLDSRHDSAGSTRRRFDRLMCRSQHSRGAATLEVQTAGVTPRKVVDAPTQDGRARLECLHLHVPAVPA
jgi:hypothetical protein